MGSGGEADRSDDRVATAETGMQNAVEGAGHGAVRRRQDVGALRRAGDLDRNDVTRMGGAVEVEAGGEGMEEIARDNGRRKGETRRKADSEKAEKSEKGAEHATHDGL